MREAEAEPGRSDACRRAGGERYIVGAELEPCDLQDDVRHALADLGRRAVHLGASRPRPSDTRALQ